MAYTATQERYDARKEPGRIKNPIVAHIPRHPGTNHNNTKLSPLSQHKELFKNSLSGGNTVNKQVQNDRQKEINAWKHDVDKIDRVHKQTQGLINHIFYLVGKLHEGKTLKHIIKLHKKLFDNDYPNIPTITIKGIILLSIQLNKLRTVHLKMKIQALTRSIEVLNLIIGNTAKDIDQGKSKIIEFNNKLSGVADTLQEQFSKQLDRINSTIEEYESQKIRDVKRQMLKFQCRNFMVLKEVSFSSDGSSSLNFMGQRILKIDHILGYNIMNINQFFESLIVLQRHLSIIFEIEFPYLEDLLESLPDADFFNSIKVKENEIRGTPEVDDEVDNDNNVDGDDKDIESDNKPRELTDTNDKIVSTNNTIRLPLSSKSYNNQRRESMKRSPSREIESILERNNKSKSSSPMPERSNSRSSTLTTSSSIHQVSKKKAIAIVPHRILKKPFSKLTMREFSQLLYIISKILFNFQVFFITIGIECTEIIRSCDFNKILQLLTTLKVDNAFMDLNYNNISSLPVIELKTIIELVYKSMMLGVNRAEKSTKRKISSIPPSYLKDITLSEVFHNHDVNSSQHPYDDWSLVSKILGSHNL
ncbi:hypothetical protein DFJ63DRAFT_310771 [Scheffersomyces coipomensis]|uniref:uncharacterized protein n=1 Tax=Scheffersomyces coipomensis TaxID=1788519 RepID=UPI00315DEB60